MLTPDTLRAHALGVELDAPIEPPAREWVVPLSIHEARIAEMQGVIAQAVADRDQARRDVQWLPLMAALVVFAVGFAVGMACR